VRAADRRATHPLVVIGGHSAFNPEPLADFVDLVVLGVGEEVVGEITEVARRGSPTVAVARGRAAPTGPVPGVYLPSLYEVVYDGPATPSITPARRRPRRRQAHGRRLGVPTRSTSSCRSPRSVHDAETSEVFRAARGLPLLAGRDDHPPSCGERPADQCGRWSRWAPPNGVRRGPLTSLSTAD
jgi:radical SAM superfamily enzyme YgiQ (UPF0313 family)